MTVGTLKSLLEGVSNDINISDEQLNSITYFDRSVEDCILLSSSKPIGVCNRTGGNVYESTVKGYNGYCPTLDEDLYTFEFTKL